MEESRLIFTGLINQSPTKKRSPSLCVFSGDMESIDFERRRYFNRVEAWMLGKGIDLFKKERRYPFPARAASLVTSVLLKDTELKDAELGQNLYPCLYLFLCSVFIFLYEYKIILSDESRS